MQLPLIYLRGEPRNGHVGFTLQNIPVLDSRYPGYVLHAAWTTPEHLTVRLQPPGQSVTASQPVRPGARSADRPYAAFHAVKYALDRERVDAHMRIVPKPSGTALWVVEVETVNVRDIGLVAAAIRHALGAEHIDATVLPAMGKYTNVIAVIIENLGEIVTEQIASAPAAS